MRGERVRVADVRLTDEAGETACALHHRGWLRLVDMCSRAAEWRHAGGCRLVARARIRVEHAAAFAASRAD